MHIRKLLLTDFRCCSYVDLRPAPGINVLVGGNAQGKSTLLEAISLLTTTRSPRAGKDTEMIRWGQETALAAADVAREARGDVSIEISLSRTEKRTMRVNHLHRVKVPELVGQLNTVLFSVDDLEVVRGEPALRRRFLNLEISQVSPQYCHALLQYRRVLEQRNRLLKIVRDTGRDRDTLSAWDEQLVASGARLVERRSAFVEALSQKALLVHRELAGSGENLGIVYVPSFPMDEGGTVVEAFRRHLELARQEELARAVTMVGPHRDDVLFLVNGADVRVYGSQGQQRSVAVAAKLAEVELVQERIGEAPVLLLDDAGAELDETRRERLYSLVRGGYQTFVACPDARYLPASILGAAAHYRVEAGRVSLEVEV